MIIILIMFSPSKIYASWFGMMQTGYENMDILNFLTNKQMNGYKAGFIFGVPKDIPWVNWNNQSFIEYHQKIL